MSADISFSCVKHSMTMGECICGECGHQFCHECVVYPFGTTKPPLCIPCALERGGVRHQTVARPKLARKSIRERLALQRKAQEQEQPVTTDGPATEPPEWLGSLAPTDEEAWLAGDVDPDDVPGAWRQQF